MQTGTLPDNFVIFCWLPAVGAYAECLGQADGLLWCEALIWNVRAGGWPFSLRVELAPDPDAIFPEMFGKRNYHHARKDFFSSLSYTLDPGDFEDDEESVVWYMFDEDFEDNADEEPALAEETVGLPIEMDALLDVIRAIEAGFAEGGDLQVFIPFHDVLPEGRNEIRQVPPRIFPIAKKLSRASAPLCSATDREADTDPERDGDFPLPYLLPRGLSSLKRATDRPWCAVLCMRRVLDSRSWYSFDSKPLLTCKQEMLGLMTPDLQVHPQSFQCLRHHALDIEHIENRWHGPGLIYSPVISC